MTECPFCDLIIIDITSGEGAICALRVPLEADYPYDLIWIMPV